MEDLVRYLDEIVEPTLEEFANNPTSVRHAFLACITVFHSVDYLTYNRATRLTPKGVVGNLRKTFGDASQDFKLVDEVAHAFKHVVAEGREERLRSHDIIEHGGSFSNEFSSDFDVSRVTIVERPEVNLLATVRNAVRFLRAYDPTAPAKDKERGAVRPRR